MKVLFSALFVSALAMTSCKNELEPQDSSAVADATTSSTPTVQNTTAAQSNSAVTYNQTSSQKMNPPHGQPGHRCDIAVGAPLPGSAQTTTSAPMQVTPQMVMNAQPSNVKTAKGMNPAHGQPGHRCDIPVGAPLNSKPAPQPGVATATPVTMTPAVMNSDGTITPGSGTNITTTTTNNATPAMLKNPTATAPGMNPPHGEPGHVCSVPVGAPLPK